MNDKKTVVTHFKQKFFFIKIFTKQILHDVRFIQTKTYNNNNIYNN